LVLFKNKLKEKKMKITYNIKSALLLFVLLFAAGNTYSQCKITNNYFQSGETLEYDLHVKWGILSKKGGSAKLNTQSTRYKGEDAFKMSLTTNSEGSVRKLFKLDDTLSCYMTKELVPLAFVKDAHEGSDYTKETIDYSYSPGGQAKLRAVRHKNGNFKFDETITTNKCIYDMMSVVFYARTLDYQNMKKGDKVNVEFMSGRTKKDMQIIHEGTETQKGNDDVKYKCIKLSLKISDDAFENSEEAMKVYITDDMNRMPVRIDSKLNFGSTRVVLKRYKGNKYTLNTTK